MERRWRRKAGVEKPGSELKRRKAMVDSRLEKKRGINRQRLCGFLFMGKERGRLFYCPM
jgi:hypothetical protein